MAKKEEANEALLSVLRREHLDDLASGALPDLANPEVTDKAWRSRAAPTVPLDPREGPDSS
jgi:hypothetical protein